VEPIVIRTSDGLTLQAELREPDVPARAGAVLCHPHPLHGGSKDHPLLWAIRADLARRGFAVLSFNFRGVMGSEGQHDRGFGELLDARAAVDTVAARLPGRPLFVVGWSFGANVALREALADDRIGAVALVGMPLAPDRLPDLPPLPPAAGLAAYERPVLLLSGDADQYSPAGELRTLGRKLADATVFVVPGANHYFTRREREAAAIVGGFAEERLLGVA
jgi:alpha/beta superfamily hydrolase